MRAGSRGDGDLRAVRKRARGCGADGPDPEAYNRAVQRSTHGGGCEHPDRAASEFHDRDIMQNRAISLLRGSAPLAWLAALIATGFVFIALLGCAVPLIAFAAICALRQHSRHALLSVAVIWLALESLGFTALHFPLEPSALGWAAAVGIALLTATAAAAMLARHTHGATRIVTTFAAVLCLYEALLATTTWAVGGSLQAFTPVVLLQVSALNALAYAGLVVARAFTAGAVARRSAVVAKV